MVRKSLVWVTLSVSLAACGLAERIEERVVFYVSGETAAQLNAEAALAVQERLLEALTGIDADYTGDAKWVVVPHADHPDLGENVTAVTQAPVFAAKAPPGAYEPAALVTQTGYVEATEDGPDGTPGWYTRSSGGFTFYYKTLPEVDLTQRWPTNVQVLWAGWRGSGAQRGQSWWLKSEIVSPTQVRGEWRFAVANDAPKYAGTRYWGTYEYERVPNEQVNVALDGTMRLVHEKQVRESYTRYAYSYTNAVDAEHGRFYYGVGPAVSFNAPPPWRQGRNPAGDAWTNETQRPGLALFKLWTGQSSAWWTYDGKSQQCSTAPYAMTVRGNDVVTVGRTQQLAADVYNTCKERLRYRTLQWRSRNPDIAAVNDAGLVSGIAPGVTDVTVMAGAAWGKMSITVRKLDLSPAKVGISEGASVQIGGTLKLTATAYNRYNEPLAGVPIKWTSLDKQIATVSKTGEIKGVANGTTTIRAAIGEVSRDRILRVYGPDLVETVMLTCPTSRTVIGVALQCAATAYSYTGNALSGTVFTWQSSDPAVLRVNASGVLTPVAKGTATVRATANGKHKQLDFVVFAPTDVAYVVVGSANGATLRFDDAAFKLSLTAKAYGADGVEIPGVGFTWTTENASIAQVAADSPSSGATVSAGTVEGTAEIRATTSNAATGAFSVGNWDTRVSSIRILDGSLNDVTSVAMAYGADFQLYVRSFNASNRALGLATPVWTLPAGLSIDANGVLRSGTTPGTGFVVQASVPKATGGSATDTLSVTVYDAAKPASLTSDCTSTYSLFAGGTLNCSVVKSNAQGAPLAGAPVTWYVSDPARLTITSQIDTGSPGSVQFQVPATLAAGGMVTFKAYAACDGAPQPPAFGNCVVSQEGAVTARGTQDIQYVTIVAPVSGALVGIGDTAMLMAKAYDHQATPQEIAGVNFTFSRQSGSSFSAPSAAGAVTAVAAGISYFQATATPGGMSSGSFAHSLEGVDPAEATVVNLSTSAAALSTLRPYQPFTVWATATNGLGQAMPGATFGFSTSNTRLEIMSSTATTATLRFVRCDCANTATNAAIVYATYTGAGGAQAARTVNVLNPVYNVNVNHPAGTLVPDSAPFTVSVTVTGQDGQAAPPAATVTLQEPSASPAYNVAGLDLVDLVYQNGNALAVNVFAEDASTASNRTAGWSFYLDPTPIVMSGAAAGVPALTNGYLAKELFYFATAGEFAKAVTYAGWATTGVTPERTYTSVTNQPLSVLDNGYYGVAKLSTGEVVTSRIGVRMAGYVRVVSPTLYLRTQAWERVRVRLGGVTVLDEWSTTNATSPRAVKLTGVPAATWLPIEITGLADAAQTASGRRLGYILWSTNGTSFFDAPSGIGASLAQDP